MLLFHPGYLSLSAFVDLRQSDWPGVIPGMVGSCAVWATMGAQLLCLELLQTSVRGVPAAADATHGLSAAVGLVVAKPF